MWLTLGFTALLGTAVIYTLRSRAKVQKKINETNAKSGFNPKYLQQQIENQRKLTESLESLTEMANKQSKQSKPPKPKKYRSIDDD